METTRYIQRCQVVGGIHNPSVSRGEDIFMLVAYSTQVLSTFRLSLFKIVIVIFTCPRFASGTLTKKTTLVPTPRSTLSVSLSRMNLFLESTKIQLPTNGWSFKIRFPQGLQSTWANGCQTGNLYILLHHFSKCYESLVWRLYFFSAYIVPVFLQISEKWCRPWWSTLFTTAKTCNSTAEANNALLKVAYNIKADSVVKLIRSTHQRSIDDQGKSLIEMDNSVYEVSIAHGLIQYFTLYV